MEAVGRKAAAAAAARAPEIAARALGAVVAGAWRDRALYGVALATQAAAFAVAPFTERGPDWALVVALGGRIALAGIAAALLLLVAATLRLALVERSPTPLADLARGAASVARRNGLAPGALHTLAIFLLFATGFAVLKGAVAVIAPFRWDAALANLDRALHLGRAPHEWL